MKTLAIPPHLTHRDKVSDLCVAYAKFLAIEKAVGKLSEMEKAGTWTYDKKPTHEDIVQVFMSRSGYHNHLKRFFPKVDLIPGMREWLMNEEDAPADAEVWGDKRPSYTSLKDLLDLYDTSERKKKGKKAKRGKGEQQIDSASSDEVVEGKGKGKAKAKPKTTKKGSSKKASSSKSRQDDD